MKGVATRVLLVVVLVAVLCVTQTESSGFDTYDQLYRTYFVFHQMPMNVTQAKQQGYHAWKGENYCDPKLGIAYSSTYGGPTSTNQGFLYFTSAGQLAGLGARIYSSFVPLNLVPNYYVPVPGHKDQYDISLIFRNSSFLCSNHHSSSSLGDQLNLNGNPSLSVPLTSDLARKQKWLEGACIEEMGTHWSLDTSRHDGSMSWNSSTLFPIMPMYGVEDGFIKAILIATPSAQWTTPVGEFEGPLFNFLMCYNWCDNSGCEFSGNEVWSTFHWFFTNYKQVGCKGAKCIS